jgi:hypothetical protein
LDKADTNQILIFMYRYRRTIFIPLILTFLIGCGVSEGQVEKYLGSMDINLKDRFKIEKSNWSTAPGDMVQTFEVSISEKDSRPIIEMIKGIKNFREYSTDDSLPSIFDIDQDSLTRILAYKQGDSYYYGIYNDQSKSGYELQEVTIDN